MKKMKKLFAIMLTLALALSVCACGSSAKDSVTAGEVKYALPAAAMPEMAIAEPEEYGLANFSSDRSLADSGSGGDVPVEDPDKIIYSASATVETTRFDDTIAGVEEMIKQYGAWMESSSISGADYYSAARGSNSNRSANFTIRVPSDKFSTMMGNLSTLGNVPYTYTYTENVTAQYYDTQAHLNAYKTQETRLLEMMEKAETVEDIVTIEDRLTELRYKIESLQTTLNGWDRRISYSTVDLSIQEVREYTPKTDVPQSYGAELWTSFVNGLRNVGQFFKELLVFLVSALPALIIITALFFILRPLLRRLKAKLARRREERKAKADQSKEEK